MLSTCGDAGRATMFTPFLRRCQSKRWRNRCSEFLQNETYHPVSRSDIQRKPYSFRDFRRSIELRHSEHHFIGNSCRRNGGVTRPQRQRKNDAVEAHQSNTRTPKRGGNRAGSCNLGMGPHRITSWYRIRDPGRRTFPTFYGGTKHCSRSHAGKLGFSAHRQACARAARTRRP